MKLISELIIADQTFICKAFLLFLVPCVTSLIIGHGSSLSLSFSLSRTQRHTKCWCVTAVNLSWDYKRSVHNPSLDRLSGRRYWLLVSVTDGTCN